MNQQPQAFGGIRVWTDVKPLAPRTPRIDCRTCANATAGACDLFPRQCDEGSAYQATKPVQYWSKT